MKINKSSRIIIIIICAVTTEYKEWLTDEIAVPSWEIYVDGIKKINA